MHLCCLSGLFTVFLPEFKTYYSGQHTVNMHKWLQIQKAIHISIYILCFYFPARQLAINVVLFMQDGLFLMWLQCLEASSIGCTLPLPLFLRRYLSSLLFFDHTVLECRRINMDTFLSLRPFKVREEGGMEGKEARLKRFVFNVSFSCWKWSFQLRRV